jgi:predicted phosphoribosyltransferase
VVGKVGVPGHEELALAAVADDGSVAVNPGVVAATGMTADEVDRLARGHASALRRRAAELRGDGAAVAVEGRTVVVVDDGMATGATMRVALDVVRRRRPGAVVAAVPVASVEAAAAVAGMADRLVCVLTPPGFRAVGPWYADFTQVSDDEVRDLLLSAVQRADDA